MSYSVETTAFFEKQLKRLVKKFPSLKLEFAELVNTLKEKPIQGKISEIIATKSGFPLRVKAKVRVAGQES